MLETSDINKIRKNQAVILFDGHCNFCNNSVQFVLKRDIQKHFLFASLSSKSGQDFLKKHAKEHQNTDSILLITENKIYSKSSAALKITQSLSGLWFFLAVLRIIPPYFRNIVYDYIAKNRYKWFGKKEICHIPTKEEKSRFIEGLQ